MKLAQLLQILVGILCLVCPGLARALDSAPANGRIAYVVASGEAEDTAAVEVVVRELVAGLPVELRWSTASGIDIGQVLAQHAPDGQVAARAWLDLSNPRRARIYVANAQDKRFVVRVVPLNDGYDEVGREVIGHIVEFALDAFLSGAEVGVSREVAERQVTDESDTGPAATPLGSSAGPDNQASKPERSGGELKPPAAEAQHLGAARDDGLRAHPASIQPDVRIARPRLGLLVAYQIREVSPLPLLHGPVIGFGIALPLRPALRFRAFSTLHYDLPATWDSPAVGARLAGMTARLIAGLETDIAPRWVVRGLLGLGADFMRVSPYPEPGTGSARAGQPLWTGSTVFAAMVDLEFAASATIGLIVGAGCDASLNRPSYFVAGDARQTTVLSPSVFHPTASFGMVFRIGHQPIALGR